MKMFQLAYKMIWIQLAVVGLFILNVSCISVSNDNTPPKPERVALTWSGSVSTTQSVTWRTKKEVENPVAQITIATPSPNLENTAETIAATTQIVDADSLAPYFYHTVRFSGLESGTLYVYRVGSEGGEWSSWNQFRTAGGKPKPFTFTYIGDMQNDIHSKGSRTVRAAYAKSPESKFMLFVGDFVDKAQSDTEWGEWFDAMGWIPSVMPIVPVLGNHEYGAFNLKKDGENFLSKFWRPQFDLPVNGLEGQEEAVYYIDYHNVRLVVMNAQAALASPEQLSSQTKWLRGILENTKQKWKILSFHHSLFSARDGNHGDYPDLRNIWGPLFEEYGVDLVLTGHDHVYSRGSGISFNKEFKEGETGPVYVVSVAGRKMYGIVPERRWMDRAGVNAQFFQTIEISGDTLRFRSYSVDDVLYDSFDIVKASSNQKENQFVEHISSETTPEYLFPHGSTVRQ